ncbi:MAG: sirohydrochlorin chelatase [Bacillota bacterium]
MNQAIIILGHGSKAPEALETLKQFGRMIKAATAANIVEIASLQFNRPDLSEAISSVVSQGAQKIVIVPLFLYKGVHIQEDIPAMLDEEKKKFPQVEMVLADSIGADRRIVDIVCDRIKEVS